MAAVRAVAGAAVRAAARVVEVAVRVVEVEVRAAVQAAAVSQRRRHRRR
jgi:hypothetical protein